MKNCQLITLLSLLDSVPFKLERAICSRYTWSQPASGRLMMRLLRTCLIYLLDYLVGRVYQDDRSKQTAFNFDGICVVGPKLFFDQVEDALNQLRDDDAHGYSLVRRYIKGVVAVNKNIAHGFISGVMFYPTTTQGNVDTDLDRFAACLVRCAVQTRLIRGFKLIGMCFFNKRCQRLAMLREMRTMRLLKCAPYYLKDQAYYIEHTLGFHGRERMLKRSG